VRWTRDVCGKRDVRWNRDVRGIRAIRTIRMITWKARMPLSSFHSRKRVNVVRTLAGQMRPELSVSHVLEPRCQGLADLPSRLAGVLVLVCWKSVGAT